MAVDNLSSEQVNENNRPFNSDFINSAKNFLGDGFTEFAGKVDEINTNYDLGGSEEEIKKIKQEILIKACASGKSAEEIEQLILDLDLNYEDINSFNAQDESALSVFLSVAKSPEEVKRFLQIKGINPNQVSQLSGNTALHLAVQNLVNEEILKAFLDDKRVSNNINIRNKEGKTPLDLAAEGENTIIAKILVDKGGQLGAFSTNNSAKPNQNSGRQVGGGAAEKYNQELEEKAQENAKKQQELIEERRIQKEIEEAQNAARQRIAEMNIQIDLHNSVKEFFAKELAKQQKKEVQEVEKLEQVEDRVELNIQECLDDLSKMETALLEKDGALKAEDTNIIEIIPGVEVDVTDKAALNLMLHHYAHKGNLEATKALLPYGDMNTTVGGRTVYEAALDSGNTSLSESIKVLRPEVVQNVRGEYKDKVYGELVKDVNLNITSPSNVGMKDDFNLSEKQSFVDRMQEKQTYVEKVQEKDSDRPFSKDTARSS